MQGYHRYFFFHEGLGSLDLSPQRALCVRLGLNITYLISSQKSASGSLPVSHLTSSPKSASGPSLSPISSDLKNQPLAPSYSTRIGSPCTTSATHHPKVVGPVGPGWWWLTARLTYFFFITDTDLVFLNLVTFFLENRFFVAQSILSCIFFYTFSKYLKVQTWQALAGTNSPQFSKMALAHDIFFSIINTDFNSLSKSGYFFSLRSIARQTVFIFYTLSLAYSQSVLPYSDE